MLYGVVNSTFPLAEFFNAGFDTLGNQLRLGEFDRVLLRPRTTVLQLLGHEFTLRRVGRLTQGALVFAWAVAQLDIDWTAWRIALLVATVIGGMCLFFGLVVLQATVCFWTTESLEAFNAFTYGGAYAAQYPMTIYAPWFRKFFTFAVPLALVAYFPMLPILGRDDPLGTTRAFQILAPLAGVAFLAVSLFAFRFGVRKYTSTGS
jgi:ABC-2 type transport system permease protein